MSLKNEIISLLEKNKGKPVSGQNIAKELGVSRSAIWKNINLLKEEGHKIKAVSNKGYTLQTASDVLTAEGIKLKLRSDIGDIHLNVFDEVTSTNILAKKYAIDNAPDRTVIVANCQKEGRGRKGRTFFSPSDTGIYMSILLKPQKFSEETIKVTLAAAVSVVNAIKNITGLEAQIKWVNDIFLNGRKICGILTEAVSDIETGSIESVVVGIGINVSTTQFPQEINNIAGSISSKNVMRNALCAQILNEFFRFWENLSSPQILEQYKAYSLVLGKDITYIKNNIEFFAKAVDINENGNLIVCHDGITDVLSSGEISLSSKNFAK